ncbi:hypothetical protein FIBSPDRAFT_877101 [Athelia psychrophila]|uniref:Uncharacterized protein n=1 Tax=Athelia psychrophila TaxID=1759441 RepID=A0A167W9G0_9AGAM|nr:hypothetical protein FIBSPDRAFT_877101 [Fibularhizoctonia sp. CBS 109695]
MLISLSVQLLVIVATTSPSFLHVHPTPIDDMEIFARRESQYNDRESSENGGQSMTGGGVGCALISTFLIYNLL